ncbi:MAG: CoA-binding protein [Planctomycetaceae bacterium]
MPTVAIIGASTDRRKFGNISVRAHQQAGYEVFPVHPKADEIEGLKTYPSLGALPVEQLDRVSLYVPPAVGMTLLNEIAAKSPREVWFNPGTADPALLEAAEKCGLNIIHACSIVNLGVSPSDFSSE